MIQVDLTHMRRFIALPYEAALTRFEARFNSPLLSDIVRGLIGVLRGDNGVHYFQMLSHDMKQLELQRLKAKGKPGKVAIVAVMRKMIVILNARMRDHRATVLDA